MTVDNTVLSGVLTRSLVHHLGRPADFIVRHIRRGHVFTRRLTAVPVQVVHCSGCDQWLAWVDGQADVWNASNFVLLQLMMMMQSVHVARLRLDKLQYVQTHLTALQHVTVSK